MPTCLSDQQVIDLIEGRLSAAERRALLAHAEGCLPCQHALGDVKDLVDTAAVPTPIPSVAPTTQVDEFRIIRQLGRGGMGRVFLAEDTSLHRLVAIKVLDELESTEMPSLLREARAIARLRHPNILTIYRVGSFQQRPYLVSEYIEGESLAERAQLRLPCDAALAIILAVGRGLSAAHAAGVLHRDIKPGNVMISSQGEITLIDFGLAAPLGTDLTATSLRGGLPTRRSTRVGTPPYMAPELWRGAAATVQSDLYALGALLYELCAGRAPYLGSEPRVLAKLVLHHRPPPLRELARQLPETVCAAVDRCLAHDPAQRFPSVEAFLAALVEPAQAPPRAHHALLAALTLLTAQAARPNEPSCLGRAPPVGMACIPGGEAVLGWDQVAANRAYEECVRKDGRCRKENYQVEVTQRRSRSLPAFFLDQREVNCQEFAVSLNRRGVISGMEAHPLYPGEEVRVLRERRDGVLLAVVDDEDGCLEWDQREVKVKEGMRLRPVTFVTHAGAAYHCRALGERLPSRDEWEFAALRAPVHDAPACQEVVYARAEGRACQGEGTQQGPSDKIGSRDVTADGVQGLLGGVSEWVADAAGQGFLLKGGNFASYFYPIPYRLMSFGPEEVGMANGFRCAASISNNP